MPDPIRDAERYADQRDDRLVHTDRYLVEGDTCPSCGDPVSEQHAGSWIAGRCRRTYRTIVADPPWTPELGATWATRFHDKARPQAHYDTMTLDDIKGIDIPAAPQAHLWLWALTAHVDWAFDTARAWGFEPVTMLTWAKPGMGVGRFQCNTEHVLLARKGSRHGNPFEPTAGTWFEWPRGAHSAKPDAFYDLVERVSPGPYVEMFSRRARLGWSTWGNESLEGGVADVG